MKINIRRLNDRAVVPTKAHNTDVGFDLTAITCNYDNYGNAVYTFGWAIEIPKGYGGFIFPRSSISKKALDLANAVGVIDPDYRGELTVKFKPTAYFGLEGIVEEPSSYKEGDRVAQLVILEVPEVELNVSEQLSETPRGQGGFGSTGT